MQQGVMWSEFWEGGGYDFVEKMYYITIYDMAFKRLVIRRLAQVMLKSLGANYR